MKNYPLIFVCLLFHCIGIVAQQHHFTVTDGLPNNQVRQIIEMPNGQMLVANEGAFSLYDGNRFQPIVCIPDSIHNLASFSCHDYVWATSDILLIKDYYSLYIFDASRMRFRYDYANFINNGKVRQFLRNNVSTHGNRCTDRQGGVWEGTETNGLFYDSPYPQRARVVESVTFSRNNHIRHMLPVGEDKVLMANAGGVYLFDTRTNTFANTLAEGKIHCTNINRSGDHAAWISTEQGLYHYENGSMQLFFHGNTSGFLHDNMRFACPIDNQRVLVCNILHSLGYFYPQKKQFVLLNNRLPELYNYRTMIDACPMGDGKRMLVATQNGIFLLNTKTNSIEHPHYLKAMSHYSNKFNCLLVDSRKRIWVGSQNGLFVLVQQLSVTGNNKTYTLHYLSTDDGLSNACIKTLAEDDGGDIFVGTAYGLNRISIDADDMHVTAYGNADGLPDSEICERGMCMVPGGKLYLSTDEQLILFDTSEDKSHTKTLQACMVSLTVNDSLWTNTNTLSLAHDQNDIVLRFSSLNYASPTHTRFRYRLVGFHDTWIVQSDGRDIVEAKFHSLAPGRYTLCIQAAIDNNPWGPETLVEITVRPQWWQTWWALMTYIIIIIFAVAKALRMYLRHREQVFEAENEARINKLFEVQSKANHQFAQQANVSTDNLPNASAQRLLERINKAIADNMDNVDYTIDHLAADIGISRASLYKKMQQILGITPNDYLRNVRLKHATKLLEQGIPVNQVSLMVGFMTPRYFSLCFKRLFGVLPSDYRQ